ncbi:MAG: ABC transporter permease subunit [Magnetococcales bacterium]|nr:ABC transporter permease subunit [Magnetococcales bacterium]
MINNRFSTIQPIITIAQITTQEGVKTKLIPLVLVVLLFGVIIASFAGTLSVVEANEIQSAVIGSFLRFTGVLIICLFVLNAQVRELNDKGLDMVLALPVPRSSYFFGKLLGFAVIAMLISLLFSLTLLFYARGDQVALWGVSLFFELLIVTTLSLLCLFTFNQLPAAFTTVFGIYLLSRALTSLILVGKGPIMPKFVIVNELMNMAMAGLAFVLPALDRFTNSAWLVYNTGSGDDLRFVLVQGLIYVTLLSAAALLDFYRKNL